MRTLRSPSSSSSSTSTQPLLRTGPSHRTRKQEKARPPPRLTVTPSPTSITELPRDPTTTTSSLLHPVHPDRFAPGSLNSSLLRNPFPCSLPLCGFGDNQFVIGSSAVTAPTATCFLFYAYSCARVLVILSFLNRRPWEILVSSPTREYSISRALFLHLCPSPHLSARLYHVSLPTYLVASLLALIVYPSAIGATRGGGDSHAFTKYPTDSRVLRSNNSTFPLSALPLPPDPRYAVCHFDNSVL
jgi:hypothetical protein